MFRLSFLFWPGFFLLFLATAWLTWDGTIPLVVLSRPDSKPYVEGESFPKTLVDSYGQRIVLAKPPQRIVSAMLASDEILLDLLPRERLAAVTRLAVVPEQSNVSKKARGLPQIPTLQLEPILILQPDLVITSRLSDGNAIALLRQCGVPVFCLGQFDTLNEIRENVLLLGQAVGEETRAEKIVAWMDQTLEEVKKRTRGIKNKPGVLFSDGGFTAGKNTIFDEMVNLAGGRNLAAEAGFSGYAQMSTEMVLALNPDVLIVPMPFPEKADPTWQPGSSLLDDPLFQSVNAVRQRRVHVLPSQHLNSISHYVVKGAVAVAHALHPGQVPAQFDSIPFPGD